MNIDRALKTEAPVLSATAGQSFTQMLINSSEGKVTDHMILYRSEGDGENEHTRESYIYFAISHNTLC